MALWGFGAKCRTGWMGDTPQSVMTTRAPAVLKTADGRPATVKSKRVRFAAKLTEETIYYVAHLALNKP